MTETPLNRRHAIVIGGSIAGLVTARVLADQFEQVTVLERDHFPDSPAPRPGVPQTRQIHVLLLKGQYILEELFPGLQTELGSAGAPEMDWSLDCIWYSLNRWAPRFRSGWVTRFASRELLEWVIRRRLLASSRVQFLQGREATGLLADEERSRITGVTFRFRPPDQGAGQLLGDLIVDASGRESRLPQWLETLGYGAPAVTTVNSFMGYASRFYRQPDAAQDWLGMLVRGTPPHNKRGGALFPIEGNRWIVNLGAAGRDYPPTDEQGLLDFARSLPDPTLYNAIRNAEPLTPIYGYRRTENRLRHYERLRNWPESLVALGDAVCAFNPVYGHGMTVAAEGAVALGETLARARGETRGVGRLFQKRLAQINATPWSLATSVDFLYPETEGPRPGRTSRLVDAYFKYLTLLSMEEREAYTEFQKVFHLLEPPNALFRPRMMTRVLARALQEHRAGTSGASVRRGHERPSAPGPDTFGPVLNRGKR